MASHDSQHTDRENSKPLPKVQRPGDDLRTSQRGSASSIASEDYRDQKQNTGKGGVVTTSGGTKGTI